jgi:hypothetical protein
VEMYLTNIKQWLDILIFLFYFLVWKNTTNKSQISIPTTYAGIEKVNLNVTNASTNL